jgi:hypothetical protein
MLKCERVLTVYARSTQEQTQSCEWLSSAVQGELRGDERINPVFEDYIDKFEAFFRHKKSPSLLYIQFR